MDSTVRSAGSDLSLNDGLPRPGDVLCGKYRIDNVIGAGGMGVVLGAVDTTLGRGVAIKVLAPHKAQREGAVARFIREARSAAMIQSEHVVRVFDIGTLPNGSPFIVMEHLRGADLAQVLIQRGPLPISDACDYILQVCEALGEAHLQGIVHRDLKPSNLYLTQHPDGAPCMKVLDFGISKAVTEDGAPNLTATDTVMGTPLYMSPEQVRSLKNVDLRADIWALGSILFELLTRAPIFEAPSASALCAMIAMDPPIPLRARRADAPPELEAVILRCLHKDPVGRFQDVGGLAQALAPFGSDRGRVSASRASRVARSGPLAHGSGSVAPASPHIAAAMSPLAFQAADRIPTTGAILHGVSYPPPAPMVSAPPPGMLGPSYPPGPHPTTQNTWQQTSPQNMPPPRKGMSGAVVAALGVGTGLLLLALVGGGAWFVIHRDPATTPVAAVDAGPTSSARVPAATAVTPTAPTTSAIPTAAPTATSSSSKPGPTPSGQKDGGAPSAKDGGAAPPPPNPDKEEQERNAALGKAAERSCQHHTLMISQGDTAARKRNAQTAKGFMCRGAISSRCERQVCLQTCLITEDKMCEQQIRYVMDHGPPPKY
jgi:serine/threonine protein kinase